MMEGGAVSDVGVAIVKEVVTKVFNSWTALRLAVDQGMASHQNAMEMIEYVAEYCTRPNTDVYNLMDLLEDIMDDRFNTLCEDDSPAEVAQVLMKFIDIFRTGDMNMLNTEISKLPPCKLWLSKPEVRQEIPIQPHEVVEDDDAENENDEPMEEDPDPGWTVVRSKKK